jgi:UDP-N-acetylglucosamine acyltransferase
MSIHPTAIVSPRAEIGSGVEIGPFTVIGDSVVIRDNVSIGSHCSIQGPTEIGAGCIFYPHVSAGTEPQDLKFKGETTRLLIGERNVFREFITLNRGTAGGGGVTTIGSDGFFMAQVHVAHDCHVGDRVIMANAATLAGHITVEDDAQIGAYSGMHQFCRAGKHAFVGGYSVVVKDPLPYAKSVGNHARCYGVNTIGLQRKGFSDEAIKKIHHAFKLLLTSKLNTSQAVEAIKQELGGTPEIDYLINFIETSTRGVIK